MKNPPRHMQRSTTGAAMLTFVLFFAFATSALMFILGQSIFADLSDFNRLTQTKQAYFAAESIVEDVVMRRVFGTYSVDDHEQVRVGIIIAYATSTYDGITETYDVAGEAARGVVVRKSRAVLSVGSGSAFNYGLQAGNGGITLSNGATIQGNIYANGPVVGSNRSSILGEVVSAGPNGLIEDVHATGSVYAHFIDNIETDVSAHYTVDLNPTGPKASDIPLGQRYFPVPDQATTSFPISTTTIQEWKDAVTDYGTVIASTDPACTSGPTPGTYTIDTSLTIGYLKVECNLDIEETGGDIYITLDGPVWVEGDISFTQGPTIRVDPALGRRSVQMIADNESDRITSSRISISQSTNFEGSGDHRSYIMLLSMNEDASQTVPTGEVAIDIGQSANGKMIAYTNSGLVEIGNGIDLREITAYRIDVGQNTDVVYEEGLTSLLFTSGPGGAYVLEDWEQID